MTRLADPGSLPAVGNNAWRSNIFLGFSVANGARCLGTFGSSFPATDLSGHRATPTQAKTDEHQSPSTTRLPPLLDNIHRSGHFSTNVAESSLVLKT